jgi:hypothetical protein
MKKILETDQSQCILQLQPYYPSCSALVGCESCLSSRNCGFEMKNSACMPGGPSGPACPIVGAIWK